MRNNIRFRKNHFLFEFERIDGKLNIFDKYIKKIISSIRKYPTKYDFYVKQIRSDFVEQKNIFDIIDIDGYTSITIGLKPSSNDIYIIDSVLNIGMPIDKFILKTIDKFIDSYIISLNITINKILSKYFSKKQLKEMEFHNVKRPKYYRTKDHEYGIKIIKLVHLLLDIFPVAYKSGLTRNSLLYYNIIQLPNDKYIDLNNIYWNRAKIEEFKNIIDILKLIHEKEIGEFDGDDLKTFEFILNLFEIYDTYPTRYIPLIFEIDNARDENNIFRLRFVNNYPYLSVYGREKIDSNSDIEITRKQNDQESFHNLFTPNGQKIISQRDFIKNMSKEEK
jgi:hypothetical protein